MWSSSPYGKVFGFLNRDSLVEVRHFWLSYAETREYDYEKIALFEAKARKRIDAINKELLDTNVGNVRGYRSAGSHSFSASMSMVDAMKLYWKTGVTTGNARDVAALGGKGRLNPTMVISSEPNGEFEMHEESDPLHGFHLAEVFDSDMTGNQRQERLASVAKAQFRTWCHSFAKYVHQSAVTILVHCGEAINFCYGLQDVQSAKNGLPKWTHLYTRPWSAKPLAIVKPKDGSSLDTFDVIDTSNLIDRVGLLKILPAAVPLLSHTPFSTLLTECQILAAEEPSDTLDALLFADATASSLIFGIAPVPHLTGFTTDSVGIEAYYNKKAPVEVDRQQYLRMRIPWKWTISGDTQLLKAVDGDFQSLLGPIAMDSNELAQWLFNLYLNMFNYEALVFGDSKKSSSGLKGRRLAGDLRCYSRTDFVVLIRFVKERVETDWDACISSLLKMMRDEFNLMSSQDTYPEFRTRLHLFGVRRIENVEKDPRFQGSPGGLIRKAEQETGVLQQSPCPPLVFVMLLIPRGCLKPFTDVSPESATTPRLYLSVGSKGLSEHHFFGIDCFFGISVHVLETGSCCDVEQDVKGWHGTSNLIVSCLVPTWMLLVGPRSNINVSLNVYPSPTSVTRYGDKLDADMTVFRCGLDDDHLSILEDLPSTLNCWPRPFHFMESPSPAPQNSAVPSLALNSDGTVKYITIKVEWPIHTVESKMLREGAKVAVSQISPCVLQFKVGKLSRRLAYPYPVNGNASVTKVSREQSFIQVTAPASSARIPGGFEINPFPVVQGRQPVPWNIPRVVLSQQPCVMAPLKFDCLHHLSVAMSEDDIRYDTLPGMKGAFSKVKQNIVALFSSIAGKHPNSMGISYKAFGFWKDKVADTLIFTHAIHHERDTGSICLEAFVVPLNVSRVKLIARLLRNHDDVGWLSIGEGEMTLWKQLLPACVERCRATWDHKSSCQYLVKGRIPLSTAQGKIPICGCGEGLDVENFPAHLSGLAMFATRIAIPLLSAVPYVEPMPPLSTVEGVDLKSPGATKPPENTNSNVARCGHCEEPKKSLQLCARCQKVRYCSKECQKSAWKEHKKDCGK